MHDFSCRLCFEWLCFTLLCPSALIRQHLARLGLTLLCFGLALAPAWLA